MSNAKDRGPKITGDDVVLATINLNTPADPASGSIDLSGSTTLSPEGAKLFIAYDVASPLDPTSGTVALDDSCPSPIGSNSDGNGRNGNKNVVSNPSAETSRVLIKKPWQCFPKPMTP
ncbi:hypothetical protein CIP107534_00626 [Corynebacterium diphtheriae]|nr:hypothetical protein CIP107521_00799 [Corynebacterium diphtheriae]CAB0551224.1 hypothetical protein CIP107534_00626 [Corynebacterium diphtheriae]CAB0589236.1 hypothetical protein CIP107546_00494 [Corynebacterium diphtheriae]